MATEVYAEFCQSIGVAHIREYEEKLLSEVKVGSCAGGSGGYTTDRMCVQEQAKKRSEFAKQIAALKTQLEYEASRDTAGQNM